MIKERKELLTFGMGKLFVKLAIPSMLGMVIVGLYNLADAFFVGQYVGKEAVGAVALMFATVLFNQGILTMIGAGSASLLSISIGKKDQETVNKLLPNLVISLCVLSGLYSIFTYFYADQIISFIGGIDEIHNLSVKYLKILLFGFIPASVGPAMNFLVRGEGKMKQAMSVMVFAGLLNILLDWILIGKYSMGIEGAAIATVISQVFFVIIQLAYFQFGNSIISLKNLKFKIEVSILTRILKVGFSQFIMLSMGVLQQIILFRNLSFYGGSDHIALMGASYRVFMFAFMVIWGFGAGLQPVIGVNYGAKKYHRIKEAFEKFKNISLIVSVSLWLILLIFAKQIFGLFIKDILLVEKYVYLFRILHSIFFAYAYTATIVNFFIGIGNVKEAGIMMISRQIIFFIPLVFILPIFFGVTGVWLAMPIADGLSISLAIYLKNKIFKQELEKEVIFPDASTGKLKLDFKTN